MWWLASIVCLERCVPSPEGGARSARSIRMDENQVRGRQAPARFAAIQFDIRGLATALQAVVGEGWLNLRAGVVSRETDCPTVPIESPLPGVFTGSPVVLAVPDFRKSVESAAQAADCGTCWPMAQMKPHSSRAVATTAVCGRLPRRTIDQ